MRTLEFEIKDGEDKPVRGTVRVSRHAIEIAFEEYGTAYDDAPVLIEADNGVPRVIVWDDTLVEDASHTISLALAANARFAAKE